MRILFMTVPASGHFTPLVPVARAGRDAGHTVAFAAPGRFLPTVEAAGFTAFEAGFNSRGRPLYDLLAGATQRPDAERGEWMLKHFMIEILAIMMTPDLVGICADWSPDLIVRDASEYGGCVVAEVFGIPHASVRTDGNHTVYTRRHRIADQLAVLRERHGLPPDPEVAMLYRYLHLAGEPPGFLIAGDSPAPTRHLLRPFGFDAAEKGEAPAWLSDLPDRPTVYATLGTRWNAHPFGHGGFPAILDALRDEPINLIVTVGRTAAPADFGEQPTNVHIVQYIPQSLLLPHCDLVVDHGGFGTVTGTLGAGLPQVVIPFDADQPQNAACLAALGAGIALGAEARTPEAIRAAVRDALATPSYRAHAARVRDEMATLPGPEYAVALLERLAVEKQPIPAA